MSPAEPNSSTASDDARAHLLGVDARDFGALGDGVHDDSDAIEAAAAEAGPSGTVLFAPGRYRITRTLALLKDQVWAGSGALMGNTTPACQLVSEVHDGPMLTAVFASLARLRLSGPGVESRDSVGVQVAGSATLRDVEIWDFGVGLDLDKSWYTNIDHVYFRFNQLAVRITYCYNVTIFDIRIHAMLRDGFHGDGIELRDRSMVTFHGGSIEQYAVGVHLDQACSAAFFGTYFESYSPGCDGVLAQGQACTITVASCQVYLNNHRGWVTVEGSRAVVNGTGNILKSSAPNGEGQAFAYLWDSAAPSLSAVLMGDSWTAVAHAGFAYRPPAQAAAGLVVDPFRVPQAGTGHSVVTTPVTGWKGALMRAAEWLGLTNKR